MMVGEDKMLVVAAVGSAVAGWWYYSKKSTSNPGASSIQAAATDSTSANPMIPGMDSSANNVVTPSQIYFQSGGFAYPQGDVVGSSGQAISLPMNS